MSGDHGSQTYSLIYPFQQIVIIFYVICKFQMRHEAHRLPSCRCETHTERRQLSEMSIRIGAEECTRQRFSRHFKTAHNQTDTKISPGFRGDLAKVVANTQRAAVGLRGSSCCAEFLWGGRCCRSLFAEIVVLLVVNIQFLHCISFLKTGWIWSGQLFFLNAGRPIRYWWVSVL